MKSKTPLLLTDVSSRFVAGSVLILAIVLVGCSEEQGITQYTVPQASESRDPEFAWHLKLDGPPDAVEKLTSQFEEFVKSIEVGQTEDGSPTWQLPEGWNETENSSSVTFKTFSTSEPDVVCTITVLPVNGGSVNDLHRNYNRWRGQVGQDEVPGVQWLIDAEAAGEHRMIEGSAGPVDWFDVRSSNAAEELRRILAAVVFQQEGPVPERAMVDTTGGETSDVPLTYEVPSNWVAGTANTGFGQLRLWNINVEGVPVRVAISEAGGDLKANLYRWAGAGQAGLQVDSDDELAEFTDLSTLDGRTCLNVMFEGPEKTVGGAIVESHVNQGFYWFFKIDGPTAAVTKVLPEFQAFVASVKFVD